MKMSEIFYETLRVTHTSLNPDFKTIPIEKRISKKLIVTPKVLLNLTIIEMSAIEHAVNNHDELVNILFNLTENIQSDLNEYSCCMCRGRVEHDDNCSYGKAVKLLEKVNGN